MNLYNIRFGFATNSSSTHSIVFVSPNTTIKDSKITDNEFGWGGTLFVPLKNLNNTI